MVTIGRTSHVPGHPYRLSSDLVDRPVRQGATQFWQWIFNILYIFYFISPPQMFLSAVRTDTDIFSLNVSCPCVTMDPDWATDKPLSLWLGGISDKLFYTETFSSHLTFLLHSPKRPSSNSLSTTKEELATSVLCYRSSAVLMYTVHGVLQRFPESSCIL